MNPAELLHECHINIPSYCIPKLQELYSLLKTANQIHNLTRIDDESGYWRKHIIDSLLIVRLIHEIPNNHLSVADLGCGAGFPAFPLAIAFPNLNITAIDSTTKKIAFVESAAKQLGLNNINAVAARGRELNRQSDWHGRFDLIASRAVADAATVFRETRNMIAADGQLVLYKTPAQAKEEIEAAEKVSAKYGFSWSVSDEFNLPGNSGTRVFLTGKKK